MIYIQQSWDYNNYKGMQIKHDQSDDEDTLTHTKNLGNKEFQNYLKSIPQTAQLIFSIQLYLQPFNPFYYSSLLVELKGKPIDYLHSRLSQQYTHLLSNTSFFHKMNHAIQSRQKCIAKIKRQLAKADKILNLFPRIYGNSSGGSSSANSSPLDAAYQQYIDIQGYSPVEVDESIQQSIRILNNIFIDMARLRDMTIYIIETVHAWRVRIQQHSDKCHQHSQVRFYYNNVDIYQTIASDTEFIWNSKLSNYIWMNAKNDPFMIRNITQIEQREEKQILEKYFLQVLYPKNEETIDKALKCFEMLTFKYQPKIEHLFHQQELLIENYLQMEKKNLDQRGIREGEEDEVGWEEKKRNEQPKNRLNPRGWVFEKGGVKKNAKERVKEIIQSHRVKMNFRPFSIANYSQKNSIALAYLSQMKSPYEPYQKKPLTAKIQIRKSSHHVHSQGQDASKSAQRKSMGKGKGEKQFQSQNQQKSETNTNGYQSEGGSRSRMFKSLTKLNPIIYEDPTEYEIDTPKHKKKQKNLNQEERNYFSVTEKQPTQNLIKINTFSPSHFQNKNDPAIQVQQEETPLNFKQFFQVFRADTTVSPAKPKEIKNAKITPLKQFIFQSRARSLPYLKKSSKILPKKGANQKLTKSKSIQKSDSSFKNYDKIQIKKEMTTKIDVQDNNFDLQNAFISLKPKTIPIDTVGRYIRHILNQQHSTSKAFTSYSQRQIQQKMQDPFTYCIIFDLYIEKDTHIGQIILSESVGSRSGKLKYTIEFMNIHIFELIISAILRVAEELLSSTPCQQVICPLTLDKADPVSSHFIALIDSSLIQKTSKFGQLNILQKKKLSYKERDVFERIYIFTSSSDNRKKELSLEKRMMSNYRSLKFQSKCLVLSSNFKLRSKTTTTAPISYYKRCALGQLYIKILSRILTKYHLKQIKIASMSTNNDDPLVQLIKNNLFMRNIITNLIKSSKEQQNENDTDTDTSTNIKVSQFSNMTDLLNYLNYKQHDYHFHFNFLSQSRFILNHELTLAQLQIDVSLQFAVSSSAQLYILHNHKNMPVQIIASHNSTAQAYLLPTTDDHIKVFLMDGSEFSNCTTDRFDFYSYISIFFKDIQSETYTNSNEDIVIPNLSSANLKINKVKCFDGFNRLFPEREFYSATMINCINNWESYYPSAVIYTPRAGSIIFQFPLLLGFYHSKLKRLLSCFVYSEVAE